MKFLGLIRGSSATHASHNFHTSEGRLSASKFDDDEICILQKTWQDLADRSTGKGIDKDTFLQYFPLNGLLGERLFAQFDTKGIGAIDFEEFITGLATVCRGSVDDKIHFVFNMYDVSHDNTVSKQELSTLLNHIPKEAFSTPSSLHLPPGHQNGRMSGGMSPVPLARAQSSSSMQHAGDTSDSDKGSVAGDCAHHDEHANGNGAGNGHDADYEDVDAYTNHGLVEQAFNECDLNHEGRLTYEEFKMWIQRNPVIMDYIESILPYHGPKDLAPHHDKKETLPHMKRLASRLMGDNRNRGSSRLSLGGLGGSLEGQMSPMSGGSLSRSHSFISPMGPGPGNAFSLTHSGPSGGSVGMGGGIAAIMSNTPSEAADNEEAVKLHLSAAMDLTSNAELKAAIGALLGDLMNDAYPTAPLTVSEVYRAAVGMEGILWKKGKGIFHSLTKRWYLVSGNCMYYYSKQADVRPKGVIFLTSNIIERVKDDDMELKGYYGLEITHQEVSSGEHKHHSHDQRLLFAKSAEERDHWVNALQHAAHVVPIEDDYVIGKELGRGRFSVVCECVHKQSKIHCAVKIIDKATIEPDEKSLLRTEIAVLKLVNHPNIIKMLGLYESKGHIYIVMEMLRGGELFERIVGRPRFTEHEAAKLMRPLLESVAYLHDLGIVHRDLKPENILCGEELEDLKIADFGLSKMVLPREKMDAACGTLSYVAPEVLTMQGYGKEADLWSVGVILFLLLCGKLPFDGDDHNEIIRSTIQADLKVNPTVWGRLSEDAKNLITSLLNKSPKDRITAREALRHPFLISQLGHPVRRATLLDAAASHGSGGMMHGGTPPPLTPHQQQQHPLLLQGHASSSGSAAAAAAAAGTTGLVQKEASDSSILTTSTVAAAAAGGATNGH